MRSPVGELGRLEEADLEGIILQVGSSRYLRQSQLGGEFEASYGFNVVFTTAGAVRVRRAFPAFGPFLDLAMDPDYNAYSLNPLVLPCGSGVGWHLDSSLQTYDPYIRHAASVVVLYALVPDGLTGGVLEVGRLTPIQVIPTTGRIVVFDGGLAHRVTRVTAPDDVPRVSLVCERYNLTPARLGYIPEFLVEG